MARKKQTVMPGFDKAAENFQDQSNRETVEGPLTVMKELDDALSSDIPRVDSQKILFEESQPKIPIHKVPGKERKNQ